MFSLTKQKKEPWDTFNLDVLRKFDQETPYFVFSKDAIRSKLLEFQKFFPNADIHYAMKANAEPEVLQTLLDAGSNFEVASSYELEMLKKIGVPANRIIYGTSVKPLSHIKDFADYGVDRFAFDSFSELEKIASVVPKANVYVRMSVNDNGSVFKFSEKFGTPRKNVVPLLLYAEKLGLIPYGISFNVGSQASNISAWAEAIGEVGTLLDELHDSGITLQALDIGGGFPCNKYNSAEYDFSIKDIAQVTLDAYHKLPYKPKLILEPGRAMIAESAILVTNVIARIERSEYTWLFLDAGVYSGLFETMAYQGSTRYKISMTRPSFDGGESLFALAGPTGDSPDVISREVLLPSDVTVGDKLIIHDVGAYSLVATCLFNGFPRPKVYYI